MTRGIIGCVILLLLLAAVLGVQWAVAALQAPITGELTQAAQAAAREDPRPELWDAVLSLPRDQRAAVVLYYYEDLPVADIASLLRVPAGTVKSRLSRARDKLRLALSDPQVTRKEE